MHWPGREPIEETVAGFEALVDAGKILSYGVSNFDVPDLEKIPAVAGTQKIACDQVLYHPGERSVENRVIPWCKEHNVAVVAYSPFGHGKLPTRKTAVGKALAQVAEDRGVSAHQVALQFVSRTAGAFVIPKASDIAHVTDNAQAQHWTLSPREITFLEANLPISNRTRGIAML